MRATRSRQLDFVKSQGRVAQIIAVIESRARELRQAGIMMGRHDEQKELFSYQVDLDQRVHADHPLRRVRTALDFSFAREAVAHTYGTKGNESVDPAVLLKLMFLLFSENVRSERELMRRLPERLDWLWFLGSPG